MPDHRQKQLERKRRKRLRKLDRVRRQAQASNALDSWEQKLSEHILDFARPLFPADPSELSLQEAQGRLRVAAAVWNMTLAAEDDFGLSGPRLLAHCREACARALPELRQEAELLLQRKLDRFADDRRMILAVDVYPQDDGWEVLAVGTVLPRRSPRPGPGSMEAAKGASAER